MWVKRTYSIAKSDVLSHEPVPPEGASMTIATLATSEAAKLLGEKSSTLRLWHAKGLCDKPPAFSRDGQLFWPLDQLKRYIQANKKDV